MVVNERRQYMDDEQRVSLTLGSVSAYTMRVPNIYADYENFSDNR